MTPIRMTPAERARLIEISGEICPAKLPLYRAFLAGQIGLCDVPRGAPFPAELRRPMPRPIVAVIGDDDHASTGPSAIPATKRFADWARAGIVDAAGAEPAHYARSRPRRANGSQRRVRRNRRKARRRLDRRARQRKAVRNSKNFPRDGIYPKLPGRGRLQ